METIYGQVRSVGSYNQKGAKDHGSGATNLVQELPSQEGGEDEGERLNPKCYQCEKSERLEY